MSSQSVTSTTQAARLAIPLARDEVLPRVAVEDPGRLVSGTLLTGVVEPRVVEAEAVWTFE